MSGLNWHKNFSHCSISESAAPSSMQKLWTPLATIFVEKKIWKKIWCGSRPIQVTPWKEFLISGKKWRFEIFGMSKAYRASGPEPWIGMQLLLTLLYYCGIDFRVLHFRYKNFAMSWIRMYSFTKIAHLKTNFTIFTFTIFLANI